MSSLPQILIVENAFRWSPHFKMAFPATVVWRRLSEPQQVPDELSRRPASVVFFEISDTSGDEPLVYVSDWKQRFPKACLGVLLNRRDRWRAPLLLEAGATLAAFSPRRLQAAAAAAMRHLAQAADLENPSLHQQIQRRLPWGDSSPGAS